MDVKVLEIAEWVTPATCYHINQVGDYRLGKHTYQRGYYSYHGMDGFTFFRARHPLEATTLLQQRPGRVSWREWMVDSPTDYRAMQIYAQAARGKVLTTGLGLGLVTQELCKNPNVTSITVIEISPNVIELIKGYLPQDSRIQLICQDFWDFIERDASCWDTIIVDIWVFWGCDQQVKIYKEEIVPENKKLKAKYPGTQIFFHGFAGMPTLEQIDQALAQGDDVDPMIYGLGKNGTGG